MSAHHSSFPANLSPTETYGTYKTYGTYGTYGITAASENALEQQPLTS